MRLEEIKIDSASLAPLPATTIRLAQVLADEKSSLDDAAKVISFDQALAADVLKMSNSTFSASRRRIETVREAVLRIGGSRILEMLISRHVKGPMKRTLPHYGYSEDDLWRHSVASAVAAESLNKIIKTSVSGVAYTAALLHDIGKLVMIRNFPEAEMQQVFLSMQSDKISWAEAEKNIFGFTHGDVGARVAQAWKLPEAIEGAIRFHNDPNNGFDPVTDSVRVANITARVLGQGIGLEGMGIEIDAQLYGRLGITDEGFDKLCLDAALRFHEVLAMYESF
jgi:putative nucleotidyltransferase with HDIG domain